MFGDVNYKISGQDIAVGPGTNLKVRLYEPKQLFGKESYNYSRDLYTVAGMDGHRYVLDDPRRVQAIEKRQKHIDRVVREAAGASRT